jgi:hypothetical protein
VVQHQHSFVVIARARLNEGSIKAQLRLN